MILWIAFLSLVLISLIIWQIKSGAPKMNRNKNWTSQPWSQLIPAYLTVTAILCKPLCIPTYCIYIEINYTIINIPEDKWRLWHPRRYLKIFVVIYMTLTQPHGQTVVLELGNGRIIRPDCMLVLYIAILNHRRLSTKPQTCFARTFLPAKSQFESIEL